MAGRAAAILVAGDAMLDVHATPSIAVRPGADVPAVVRVGIGGQGANVAVRLAPQGLDVRLVCPIADDEAGRLVRDRLSRAGVTVVPVPARATGAVGILLDDAGERTMLSDRVPFRPALAARLPELAPTADWIVVSGYLLEEAGPPFGARLAPDTGRMLLGCPFRDAAAWRAGAEALRPDLLVVNRAEAAALAGSGGGAPPSAPDLAVALGTMGLAAVAIVTDVTAAAGAVAGEIVDIPIAPDPAVVDTTGAGDAFAATVLAVLHASWPPPPEALRAALERAAAVATGVARAVGAQVAVESVRGASG